MVYNNYNFKNDNYMQKLENDEVDKISKINSAGIINITIENLWRDSYSCMAKGDLVTWNRKLDAIWCILGGDVKAEDDGDKQFNKIELDLHNTGSLNHKIVGFNKTDPNISGVIAKQYLILRKKSLFLRRLQNKQGKGTAYASDDEDDF